MGNVRINQEELLIGETGLGNVRTNQEELMIGLTPASKVRLNQAELMMAVNPVAFTVGNTRLNQVALLMATPTAFNFIPIPANPNVGPVVQADPRAVDSRTAVGFESWFAPYPPIQSVFGSASVSTTNQPFVLSNGHPVVTRADGALWDIVDGVYVTIDQTSIGTGRSSKNGQ